MLVTFGFGPYVDYASISVSGGNAITQFRVGGELVAYADIIGNLIGLTPYGRFGWGYSGNSQSVTIASVTANTLYYGTGGHTLFGLSYKVIPMVYLFAEAGAQWSSLTASVPDSLKAYSSSFSDQTTSGWRVSLGAMLWL